MTDADSLRKLAEAAVAKMLRQQAGEPAAPPPPAKPGTPEWLAEPISKGSIVTNADVECHDRITSVMAAGRAAGKGDVKQSELDSIESRPLDFAGTIAALKDSSWRHAVVDQGSNENVTSYVRD